MHDVVCLCDVCALCKCQHLFLCMFHANVLQINSNINIFWVLFVSLSAPPLTAPSLFLSRFAYYPSTTVAVSSILNRRICMTAAVCSDSGSGSGHTQLAVGKFLRLALRCDCHCRIALNITSTHIFIFHRFTVGNCKMHRLAPGYGTMQRFTIQIPIV